MTVFERIAKWNSARYPRTYSACLTKELLLEEVKELHQAATEVDTLDALGDIAYVAIGALWKLGTTQMCIAEIQKAFMVLWDGAKSDHTFEQVFDNLLINLDEVKMPDHILVDFYCVAFCAMEDMGVDPTVVMNAICDSNDSKTVHQTNPHIKANAHDKGPYYKEPKLQEILDAR